MTDRLGPVGFRIAATGSTGIDWPTLDATWRLAGELGAFDAGWLSDHLSDAGRPRGGPAFEAFTTAAALAHHVPGRWIGIAVASATFRHPAVVAKAATVLDNVTDGRFILGMGAGWHEGEHDAYGVELPALPERFDRFESSVRAVRALFSEAATTDEGVTLDDPIHPLRAATNLPPPVRPGGPQLWLGGQKRRGIAMAARWADGWPMPGNRPGDLDYFVARRDALRAALVEAGRDPEAFSFAAQIFCDLDAAGLRAARESALAFRRAGATHVILGIRAADAPGGLRAIAREVADAIVQAG